MAFTRRTIGLAIVCIAESTALAVDSRGRHSKIVTSLVPAYQECQEPTLTHNPPVTMPACVPRRVTDEPRFGPRGWGEVQLKPVIIFGLAGNVRIDVNLHDVQNGDGMSFNGTLLAVAQVRSTDRFCVGDADCTMGDLPGLLPMAVVAVPCGTASSPPLSSGRCRVRTTANAILSNVVTPGKDANVEIAQIQIYDGPNLVFVQGLLLP